jgi:membrane protein
VLHNYWILPDYRLKIKKLRLRDVLPGSIFAAVGMLLVTIVYSIYSNSPSSYMSALYGSLSSIIVLMFWFYLLSWVMILGMLFNKVWMDTKDIDAVDVGR